MPARWGLRRTALAPGRYETRAVNFRNTLTKRIHTACTDRLLKIKKCGPIWARFNKAGWGWHATIYRRVFQFHLINISGECKTQFESLTGYLTPTDQMFIMYFREGIPVKVMESNEVSSRFRRCGYGKQNVITLLYTHRHPSCNLQGPSWTGIHIDTPPATCRDPPEQVYT